MTVFRNRVRISFFLLLICLSFACFPSKKLTIGSTARLLEDVAKASSKQSDLRLIRQGMPAFLILMDGMVEGWPQNERLLLAAAQGYASFASVVMEDEEKGDARPLLEKGKDYALRALESRGLEDPVQSPFEVFGERVHRLGKEDVPYLFWGASCWGSWIGLNLDSMEALSRLPRVELMMGRVLQLEEGFYYGGAHLFMGILQASRPKIGGGDLKKAQEHFLRALDLGQGKFLMTYVYYADHYARRSLKKDLFISSLQKVLETPADISPELTLVNTVAKKKAKELLDRADEYFEED